MNDGVGSSFWRETDASRHRICRADIDTDEGVDRVDPPADVDASSLVG